MDTKLTLRLDKDIIERIKIFALRNQRSVSALTEDLYKQVLIEKQEIAIDISSPIAKKYKGILGKEKTDTSAIKYEYLKEKHIR